MSQASADRRASALGQLSSRTAVSALLALLVLSADVFWASLARGDGGPPPVVSASAVLSVADIRCPFTFGQGMPPGVFCVYDGIAIGSHGQACSDRVIVIWTRLAPAFNADGRLAEDVTDRADVHFAFVTFPDLVIRAGVDDGAERRAAIIDYTLGDDQRAVRLRGSAETRVVAAAGGEAAEVLGLRIDPQVLASETCTFTSYDGAFVGVMTLRADVVW